MTQRSPFLPGWARRHVVLTLGLILLLALVLRIPVHESSDLMQLLGGEHEPVAAAIGLTDRVAADAALATYVNAVLYGSYFRAVSYISPDVSPIDFATGFIIDPSAFAAPAHYAVLVAGVAAVLLLWVLMRRLFDPVTALAAAFMLAIHPTVVAVSGTTGSGAFALLLLLAALLVSSEFTRREPRHVDFVAIGLCLGFAMEALPVAAIATSLAALFALYHLPDSRHPRISSIAIGLVCFALASLAVAPGIFAAATMASIMVGGVLWAVALIAVFHTLMVLQRTLSPQLYCSVVLCVAVLTGLWALDGSSSVSPEQAPAPAIVASQWMVENLPEGSLIVVDPALSQQLSIPRNAQSWKRELESDVSGGHSRLYVLAAARAASMMAGPSWDVLVCADPISTARRLTDANGANETERFLLLPESIEPADRGEIDLWLVARFRDQDAPGAGVAIWGLPHASTCGDPAHVRWLIRDADRLTSAAHGRL